MSDTDPLPPGTESPSLPSSSLPPPPLPPPPLPPPPLPPLPPPLAIPKQPAPLTPLLEGHGWALLPPKPGGPQPAPRRPRPLGCKTIFCGGLPIRLSTDLPRAEAALSEMFTMCGQLRHVRASRRRFAHIRFLEEAAVDSALQLSNCRLVVEDPEADADRAGDCVGRLHVDFAENADDLAEFELKARHQAITGGRTLAAEPRLFGSFQNQGQVVSYISELFRNNTWESVAEACACLSYWLDRGDLEKDTAGLFHTLLQTAHCHVRRLVQERGRLLAELQEAREKHWVKVDIVIKLLNQIRSVLELASKQRHSDHFSKGQRKNLLAWVDEARKVHEREQAEYLSERQEDEMDLDSDTEPANQDCAGSLGVFNASATAGPVPVVAIRPASVDQEVQTIPEPPSPPPLPPPPTPPSPLPQLQYSAEAESSTSAKRPRVDKDSTAAASANPASPASSAFDRRLLCLMGIFLHAHPRGASLAYIHSYMNSQGCSCRLADIDSALTDNPCLFKSASSGEGANLQTVWFFRGFSIE